MVVGIHNVTLTKGGGKIDCRQKQHCFKSHLNKNTDIHTYVCISKNYRHAILVSIERNVNF